MSITAIIITKTTIITNLSYLIIIVTKQIQIYYKDKLATIKQILTLTITKTIHHN